MVVGNCVSLSLKLSVEKRWVILMGNFFMVSGIICIGPSKMLHLPNYYSMVMLGLFMGGFGRGLIGGFPAADAMRGGIRAYPER